MLMICGTKIDNNLPNDQFQIKVSTRHSDKDPNGGDIVILILKTPPLSFS